MGVKASCAPGACHRQLLGSEGEPGRHNEQSAAYAGNGEASSASRMTAEDSRLEGSAATGNPPSQRAHGRGVRRGAIGGLDETSIERRIRHSLCSLLAHSVCDRPDAARGRHATHVSLGRQQATWFGDTSHRQGRGGCLLGQAGAAAHLLRLLGRDDGAAHHWPPTRPSQRSRATLFWQHVYPATGSVGWGQKP